MYCGGTSGPTLGQPGFAAMRPGTGSTLINENFSPISIVLSVCIDGAFAILIVTSVIIYYISGKFTIYVATADRYISGTTS